MRPRSYLWEIRGECIIFASLKYLVYPKIIDLMSFFSGFSFRMVFSFCLFLILPLTFQGQDTTSVLFETHEKRLMGKVAVASGLLFTGAYLTDGPVRDWVQSNQGPTGDVLTNAGNRLGDKEVVLSMNAALLGTGYLIDDPGLKKTSWNAVKSILSTAVITETLKLGLGRSRPYTGAGPRQFNPLPPNRHAFKSLPSGHASVAFAFFTPFAEKYSRWIYLLPASTAISRVYKDKHWGSDVVLGAAIGFFTGYFFQHKDQSVEVSLNKIVIRF
jgi:membrane-associated phospholipid phosphatase